MTVMVDAGTPVGSGRKAVATATALHRVGSEKSAITTERLTI